MGKKTKRSLKQAVKPRRPGASARAMRSPRPTAITDEARILQGMVSANPDRMSFVDRDYIYREVNEAYLRAHDCSRDDIVGRHVADILGPETFEKTIKPHFDLCLSGTQVRYQDWFHFRSLGRRFVDVIYNPFFDESGTVTGVVVTARDFTEAHLTDAALQETRMRLNTILAATNDVVWIRDVALRKTVFVSAAYKTVWGRPVEELYADSDRWMSPIHPEDQAHVRAAFAAIDKGLHFDEEYRILRPDGTVRWIHDRGFATYDPQGRALQITGIARDVTDRKRLELELSKERQRARAFLHNSAVVAWMKDAEGRYVFLSDNFEKRFRARLDEWKGKTDLELWPPDIAAQFREHDRQVLRSQRPLEGIEKAVEADGSISSWLVSKFPFEDQDGNRYIGGIAVDITARIRADEERQKFVALAERSHEFIGMCGRDFVPFFLNAAGQQMVGLDSLEAAKKVKLQDCFFPEDQPFILNEFLPRVEREGHGEVEIRFRHFKTGEPIWMLYNVFPIDDSGGAIVGWATVSRNITDRKRAEQARRQLEEKLAHAQKLEAVGNLAAGMAHDINSLLMVILGNVDVIRFHLVGKGKKRDPQELIEATDRVISAVDRGKALLDKLLTFGRIRTSKPGPIDLNTVVRETLKLVTPVLGGKIRVEERLHEGLRRCEADRSQLQQVVMNLVMNSRDAMPKGGTLTLTTENVDVPEFAAAGFGDIAPGAYVVLSVTDTGEGMDAETLRHAFEPFFSTKPVNKGSGLGLSIAHGVVKQAGGHIAVQSEVGKGATFRVFLPAIA